jgi:F0F1-type ATP synthase alpha subunit
LLEQKDSETQRTIKETENWKKLIKQADGSKVEKTDIQLLKKAVKRKNQEKLKSSNEWKNREKQVKKAQDLKQKKRTDNLNARKKTKKRPGFEGSRKK